MRQRIRVSAIVIRDDAVLLLRHVVDGREWWCPPGGGVDGKESLLAAAERELLEETSITARAQRIVYLLDFVVPEPSCRNLEVYVLMGQPTGEPSIPASEAHYLKQARFVSRSEMLSLTVYPAVLWEDFWHDLDAGFPEARYLGVTTMATSSP